MKATKRNYLTTVHYARILFVRRDLQLLDYALGHYLGVQQDLHMSSSCETSSDCHDADCETGTEIWRVTRTIELVRKVHTTHFQAAMSPDIWRLLTTSLEHYTVFLVAMLDEQSDMLTEVLNLHTHIEIAGRSN